MPTVDPLSFIFTSGPAISVPSWTIAPAGQIGTKLPPWPVELPARFLPQHEASDTWTTTPVSGTITGTVSEGGIPVPFAMVHCYYRKSGERIAGARCDVDGNFTISNLDPTTPADPDDGKYFVVALDPSGGTLYNALIYDRVVPS